MKRCWLIGPAEIGAKSRMQTSHSPGAAWVDRFLQPLLVQHFSRDSGLSCLQLGARDPTEAEQLRVLGHLCELLEATPSLSLEVPDASCDFAFTGRFPVVASEPEARVTLGRELHRVLRPKGALLLVFGNRLCPFDLTRNGPLLHAPGARYCLSVNEARKTLIDESGFSSFRTLSVCGHYGWNQLPAWLRWAGKLLDAYWRWIASPARGWLYFSPLNPTLVLWLNKA